MDQHTERMIRYSIMKAEKRRQLARRRKIKNKINCLIEEVKAKAPGIILISMSFIFSQFSKGEEQTAAVVLFLLGIVILFANIRNVKTSN